MRAPLQLVLALFLCTCPALTRAGETLPGMNPTGQWIDVAWSPAVPLKQAAGEENPLEIAQATAQAYLLENHQAYGIAADSSDLLLDRTKHSLLGIHLHFQQTYEGKPVDRAGIALTLDRQGKRVIRVFHHAVALGNFSKSKAEPRFSPQEAGSMALAALHGRGQDLDIVSVKPTFFALSGELVAGYLILVAANDPRALFEVRLDGSAGQILEIQNRLRYLHRSPKSEPRQKAPATDSRSPKMGRSEPATDEKAGIGGTGKRVQGTALIFDPDPRTALGREDLQDDSPAADFEAAYVTADLLDLNQTQTGVALNGPFVRIQNFDPPHTAPSTSPDGSWQARRGDNAFNDVMTYHHIDQNQRYIQSLGFSGATGIQNAPIVADTDGHNGEDLSSYDPVSNRLSFGHGCVDDNEDADQILHMYALAIIQDINPSWGGGDSAAIAQGFGDYWAGSYSLSRPGGAQFHPEWVFGWDGHGTGAACWEGRYLDRGNARYVAGTGYQSDQDLGGYQAAELWSTPLFQSLLSIMQAGGSREEVDAILLEALFGSSFGVTMPDLARSIIAVAKSMFSDGPHAEIFGQQFLHHEILLPDHVDLVAGTPIFAEAGPNGYPDPGESVNFTIPLTNLGTLPVTSISAELSSITTGAVLLDAQANYSNLAAGQSGANLTAFRIQLDSGLTCGQSIALNLRLAYSTAGGQATLLDLPVLFHTGQPRFEGLETFPQLAIPDNDPAGLTATLLVDAPPNLLTPQFQMEIDISHPFVGDLVVVLYSPEGYDFLLADRPGNGNSSATNLHFSLPIAGSQDNFLFQEIRLKGAWTLQIFDHAAEDRGFLTRWTIYDNLGATCDIPAAFETSHSLFFPFAEDNQEWATSIGLINNENVQANLILSAFDREGVLLGDQRKAINGHGRLFTPLSALLETNDPIALIRVDSDRELVGFSNTTSPTEDQSFAVEAPQAGSDRLFVPHIAENPDFWTRGWIANSGESAIQAAFTNSLGQVSPIAIDQPNTAAPLNYRDDFFIGPIPRGAGWGTFNNQTAGSGSIVGVELFGLKPLFSSVAGLTLNDHLATQLVMPHIPADKASWWAGLVLVNPNASATLVRARVFDKPEETFFDAEVLADVEFEIPPGAKVSQLYEAYFSGLDVGVGEWVLFTADQPITGYQLFGTQNPNAGMAGLEALAAGATDQILPHLLRDNSQRGNWTGLGFVNPQNDFAPYEISYYDDAGNKLSRRRLFMGGWVKMVGSLFDFSYPVTDGATWARVIADQPIIAFELFGNTGSDMLSGINALRPLP